jgi:hypothetical protein
MRRWPGWAEVTRQLCQAYRVSYNAFHQVYNRQRALCKDYILIRSWFELVKQTMAKYGILNEDVHNFAKAGFMMSKVTTQLVVTGSERRGRPKAIQPGNCE